MDGHALWQWISHTAYVWVTVIGSIVVFVMLYRQKRKEKNHR
jgi:heme/copper-type cytochrome/quinol oxidase subunit 2